jgi:hypothetical protein
MWKNPYMPQPCVNQSAFGFSDEHQYVLNLFMRKIDKTEWRNKVAENMTESFKERNEEFIKSKEYKIGYEVWKESEGKVQEKYAEYYNSQMCIDAMTEFVGKHSSIKDWDSYPESYQTLQKWGIGHRHSSDFNQNKDKIDELLS